MRHSHAPKFRTLSTAIVITYITLGLTGCATTGADTAPIKGEQPTMGSADNAPTAQPQTQPVAQPTFDPKDPNFKLFDPCTELSDEVFQKAGLGKRTRMGEQSTDDFVHCAFSAGPSRDYLGTISLSMNKINLGIVRSKTHIIQESVQSAIPNVYQYRLNPESTGECTSVAQTSAGQFQVTVLSFEQAMKGNKVCEESLAFLEILYPEVEKKIRNGTDKH